MVMVITGDTEKFTTQKSTTSTIIPIIAMVATTLCTTLFWHQTSVTDTEGTGTDTEGMVVTATTDSNTINEAYYECCTN